MILRAGRRGQPLVALGAVFAVWIGLRAALWESPLTTLAAASEELVPPVQATIASKAQTRSPTTGQAAVLPVQRETEVIPERPARMHIAAAIAPSIAGPLAGSSPQPFMPPPGAPATARSPAFSAVPVRDAVFPVAGLGLRHETRQTASRWSGEAWLLYRPGSSSALAPGAFGGRYGASQAGAILRYRLASDTHARRPIFASRVRWTASRIDTRRLAWRPGRPRACRFPCKPSCGWSKVRLAPKSSRPCSR
ncbi:MAG: hypothetical protein ACTHKM_14135 [Tsuneonella sp.]